MLTDLPYKICNAIIFNLTLYFMVNLNRQPGNFFFFLLISFMLTLVMSMLFRTIASVSRTLSQAMAPAAILILAIVIYTGFALPVPNMRGWARWINYLVSISLVRILHSYGVTTARHVSRTSKGPLQCARRYWRIPRPSVKTSLRL